jgi:hypothetical protein
MPRILSLDPGGTTGIANIYYANNAVKLFSVKQVPGGLEGFLEWVSEQKLSSFDVVVCEDFSLRTGIHSPDLSPVYIIGALSALCRGKVELVLQMPSQKSLCDDPRLKSMGMHTPGQPHGNDAVRHGIIYLRNKRHMPTLKLGWKDDE